MIFQDTNRLSLSEIVLGSWKLAGTGTGTAHRPMSLWDVRHRYGYQSNIVLVLEAHRLTGTGTGRSNIGVSFKLAQDVPVTGLLVRNKARTNLSQYDRLTLKQQDLIRKVSCGKNFLAENTPSWIS